LITPEQTLARFRDVVVDNNSRIVLDLSLQMRALPVPEQRKCFGGDYQTGFVYTFRSDKYPDHVMEAVVAVQGDAISGLYRNHSAFATLGTIIAARTELIKAVSAKLGLSAERIGIEDPARGRTLGLAELTTGQLIDILADRMGAAIAVVGSYGGDLALAKSEMPA
jgi:hypothetical protein